MADWRQIQARIRKAKTSSDPAAQLAELYQRTRDAMVAFELAQWHEKAGNASETVQWYTMAAQRFRRAQWRTKAQEALTRLGAPIPQVSLENSEHAESRPAVAVAGESSSASPPSHIPYDPAVGEEVERERSHGPDESAATISSEISIEAEEQSSVSAKESLPADSDSAQGKRRRRGRRGGRKRRGRGGVLPQQSSAAAVPPAQISKIERSETRRSASAVTETEPAVESASRLPSDLLPGRSGEDVYDRSQSAAPGGWQSPSSGYSRGGSSHTTNRSRAGDPGLSSRIAQLESQLRRLLACPMSSLEEAEQAPAGPGVLLLSDSDQVTHYYIEACQTLRIGIGNLGRGGRGSKGGAQLKPTLAEHLGINDSKVSKYLKDHCAVRWIQLDEGAAELAHFAIAVLHPVVTE